MGLHQALAAEQAQTGADPAVVAVAPGVFPEQIWQALGRYARPLNHDRNLHAEIPPHRLKPDGFSPSRVPLGIGEQVAYNLNDALLAPLHPGKIGLCGDDAAYRPFITPTLTPTRLNTRFSRFPQWTGDTCQSVSHLSFN